MIIIGIDPGQSGGIAVIQHTLSIQSAYAVSMPETDSDVISEIILAKCSPGPAIAYLEQVNAMPKQGVSSTFKFGMSYGFLRGALAALEIRRNFVRPQVWQKALGCLSKGDKNVTKRRAQELFPDIKITHALADALLIAEYGRRVESGLLTPK